MQPTPGPRAKREAADGRKLIAADLINPSGLLMDSTDCLKLLLSRSTIIEPKAIHFHGVRLIEIPLGAKLKVIRFLSQFWKVRLPDEFELCVAAII